MFLFDIFSLRDSVCSNVIWDLYRNKYMYCKQNGWLYKEFKIFVNVVKFKLFIRICLKY